MAPSNQNEKRQPVWLIVGLSICATLLVCFLVAAITLSLQSERARLWARPNRLQVFEERVHEAARLLQRALDDFEEAKKEKTDGT